MKLISIIIPAHNEEKNIPLLSAELTSIFQSLADRYRFEVLLVNDGSTDGTLAAIEAVASKDSRFRVIDFSRNFGKEMATTAGINQCQGDACMMLDADLQHPVERIPDFIAQWEAGADVVVGIRRNNQSDSLIKKIGSSLFYSIINRIAEVHIVPNATDFRLIDRIVIDEFNRLTERNRMSRALIDWLGFRRAYIRFTARERVNGAASYSFWKLLRLAVNGFVSLSLVPLKVAGYLGIFITLISGILGFYILLGKYIIRTDYDVFFRFSRTFSDAENLAILILFLVGILLISVGLVALYVANIHTEVIHRPLYVVRRKRKDETSLNA